MIGFSICFSIRLFKFSTIINSLQAVKYSSIVFVFCTVSAVINLSFAIYAKFMQKLRFDFGIGNTEY